MPCPYIIHDPHKLPKYCRIFPVESNFHFKIAVSCTAHAQDMAMETQYYGLGHNYGHVIVPQCSKTRNYHMVIMNKMVVGIQRKKLTANFCVYYKAKTV